MVFLVQQPLIREDGEDDGAPSFFSLFFSATQLFFFSFGVLSGVIYSFTSLYFPSNFPALPVFFLMNEK